MYKLSLPVFLMVIFLSAAVYAQNAGFQSTVIESESGVEFESINARSLKAKFSLSGRLAVRTGTDMLAMLEQKESREQKIVRVKKEREEKLIAVLKLEVEKYRKIAASKDGWSIKSAAWKSLIAKCPQGWADGVKEGDWEKLLVRISLGRKYFVNSLCMEFVYIKPGTFLMGSQKQHEVTLTKGFYMQTTEVTQRQWHEVMGTRPWYGERYVRDADNNPAVYVSWEDAQAFIRALNRMEGKDKYRLPTEAEWEYVCRAGSTTSFCFGVSKSQLKYYAWYDENAWDVGDKYAHRVGTKKPNAWGVYDMHGNVWEWCQDWYGNYPSGSVTDPQGLSSDSRRVGRGGSWHFPARRCQSAYRYDYSSGHRVSYLGFRLARTF